MQPMHREGRAHRTCGIGEDDIYDPDKLGYRHLLFNFFRVYGPTTKNWQGKDVCIQYRSAIYYVGDSQSNKGKY